MSLDPRSTGDGLERLYAVRFSEKQRVEKALLWQELWRSFFSRYAARDATVLDIGAGYCELINAVVSARRIAIDLNPKLADFAAPGVETHVASLDRIGSVVAKASVDVVFASNVLEHLRSPDELLAVLAAVREVLRPGGRLVVVQPNVRMVGGAFWDFVDHTLPLTEKGMVEAVTAAGLDVIECRARFLPYTTRSRLPQSPLLVRFYLAFRPAHWLLGKQMLVVAERR